MSDAHRVVVYYQTQFDHGNYVSPLPLVQFITHLILAAFHVNVNKPIPIALNDNSPDDPIFDQMWDDIAQLKQENGIKVLGLLGGAADNSYEWLTSGQFNKYYPYLRDVIIRHDLDGLDLDVEQSVPINDIIFLINHLRGDFGPDFIITLAPVASALQEGDNLSGFDYLALEKQVGSEIAWYNAQFYSGFGTISPDDQYISIVESNKPYFPTNRVVATTLTNTADGSGYVPVDDVADSIQALVRKYGNAFGGAAGWEYFNSYPDPQRPYLWAQEMQYVMANPNSTTPHPATRKSQTRPIPTDEFGRPLSFMEYLLRQRLKAN